MIQFRGGAKIYGPRFTRRDGHFRSWFRYFDGCGGNEEGNCARRYQPTDGLFRRAPIWDTVTKRYYSLPQWVRGQHGVSTAGAR